MTDVQDVTEAQPVQNERSENNESEWREPGLASPASPNPPTTSVDGSARPVDAPATRAAPRWPPGQLSVMRRRRPRRSQDASECVEPGIAPNEEDRTAREQARGDAHVLDTAAHVLDTAAKPPAAALMARQDARERDGGGGRRARHEQRRANV